MCYAGSFLLAFLIKFFMTESMLYVITRRLVCSPIIHTLPKPTCSLLKSLCRKLRHHICYVHAKFTQRSVRRGGGGGNVILIANINHSLFSNIDTSHGTAEAKFMDEIQTKVYRVSLLAIHNHLYNIALRFLFLQTHGTFYGLLQFSYCNAGLRNPYRNLKSENSQDYSQKPQ